MKYQIERQGEEVVIRFDEVGGDAQAVIDAIGRCRVNAWECSGVCQKIGNMAPCDRDGTLSLRLKPRGSQALDVASLGECLKYQLPRFFEEK